MPSFLHSLLFSAPAIAAALPQIPSFSMPTAFGGDLSSASASGSGFAVPASPLAFGSGSAPTTSSAATSAVACTDYMLIFARGTSEPQGFGSVGKPLDTALKNQFPSYSSYAVVYPAGFDQNSASGSADALNKMTSVIASCPQTKFIVSGYSQGASLCHGIKAGTSVKNAVSSVLLFGDPYYNFPGNPSAANLPVNDNSRIFNACNSGDSVCGKPNALGTGSSHLDYGPVVPAAATFAKKASAT